MGIAILHLKSPLGLRETSAQVFAALGIRDYAQHESDNYPEGIYFAGRMGDIRIKVSHEDDDTYSDYQYWTVVQTLSTEGPPFTGTVSRIAKAILQIGFDICREIDSNGGSSRREVYCLQPGGNMDTELVDAKSDTKTAAST